MSFLVRGALVEYGSNFLGPLPNIVVFQFNPEQLSRTITIPGVAQSATDNPRGRRNSNVTSPPAESFSLTAHFSAADDLGANNAESAIPRVFGIGPQLATIEKMVYPSEGFISDAIGAVIDGIGNALSQAANNPPGRPIPAEDAPKILFIWGASRVVPVTIKSLTITEQQFDALLNPVKAQVQLSLVIPVGPLPSDTIGNGALAYTGAVKELQAASNLVKAVDSAIDIIPF